MIKLWKWSSQTLLNRLGSKLRSQLMAKKTWWTNLLEISVSQEKTEKPFTSCVDKIGKHLLHLKNCIKEVPNFSTLLEHGILPRKSTVISFPFQRKTIGFSWGLQAAVYILETQSTWWQEEYLNPNSNKIFINAPEHQIFISNQINYDIGLKVVLAVQHAIKENYFWSVWWKLFVEDGEQSFICLLKDYSDMVVK